MNSWFSAGLVANLMLSKRPKALEVAAVPAVPRLV